MAEQDRSYLHPEAVQRILAFEAAGKVDLCDFPVTEARAIYNQICQMGKGDFDYKGTCTEHFAPSSNVAGGIPMFVNKPADCPDNAPILVYFFGGGFTIGSREARQMMCQMIATLAPCITVNVQYRLAPEWPYPHAFNDAVDAVKWVVENKAVIGGGVNSKLGVAGDSAGGNLAASVVFDVTGIDFEVLIYPRIGTRIDTESFKKFSEGHLLSTKIMTWFAENYKLDPEDVKTNPLKRESLSGVPPTLFIVAECDPLRDDSYIYSQALDKAGVNNKLVLMKGVLHSFFHYPGFYPENCKTAYNEICAFIKQNGYP